MASIWKRVSVYVLVELKDTTIIFLSFVHFAVYMKWFDIVMSVRLDCDKDCINIYVCPRPLALKKISGGQRENNYRGYRQIFLLWVESLEHHKQIYGCNWELVLWCRRPVVILHRYILCCSRKSGLSLGNHKFSIVLQSPLC